MEKYTQQLTVKSYDTNQYGKASLVSLYNFMLEAAWAHAQTLDWGYDTLKNNNLFWVLSRMYIEVEKYPAWQDEITLNTWSAGTDGMYAYREFILTDKSGGLILRASSAWLILDMENKRVFRLMDYRDTFPRRVDLNACRNPQRIKPQKHSQELVFTPVRFGELDINRHFNSVKYVERVLDNFGIDFLNDHEPFQVEINYLKEGLAGDRLAVACDRITDSSHQITIVRESDGADLCTMTMAWRPRNKS
jgi:acyl-ACP thioesterase